MFNSWTLLYMSKYTYDHLNILRKIKNTPGLPQRKIAKDLGFSLGKLNYCIKSLSEKGLIKINNFKNNNSKLNYLYLITPKGISEKTKLTIKFMKLKIKEYDELKVEHEKERYKK